MRSALNRLLKQSPIRKQAGAMTASRSVNILFALAVAVVLARMLDEDLYGSYRKIWLVYALLGPMVISPLVNTLYYRGPSKGNRIDIPIITGFLLSVGYGIVVSSITYFGADLFSGFLNAPELADAFRMFTPYVFLSVLGGAAEPIFVLVHRKKWLLWFNFITSAIESAVLVVTFWMGWSLEEVITAILIGPALRALAIFAITLRELDRLPKWEECRVELPRSLTYGLGLSGAVIVGVAVADIDKWIIGWFYDSEAIYAIYSIGARKIPFISAMSGSVASSIIVNYADPMKRNDFSDIVKAIRNATFQLFVLVLPLIAFCVIYAEAIMVLVFEKYIASADIFRLYVLGTIWGLFIPQAIILGKGKSYVQARFGAIQLVFNLLLSLLLIFEIGILGPAIGSFIGGAIYVLFQVGYCKRAYGLGWSEFLPSRAILPVLATVILYGLLGAASRIWLDMFGALWMGALGLGMLYILNYFLVRHRLNWI